MEIEKSQQPLSQMSKQLQKYQFKQPERKLDAQEMDRELIEQVMEDLKKKKNEKAELEAKGAETASMDLEEVIKLISKQELYEQKRQHLVDLVKQFNDSPESIDKGQNMWRLIENEARSYAVYLCEELKTVLEPQQYSQFKGDYKSGKRLNMKKIIPYIASNFRKDKIWLRRNQPNKRTY